MDKHSRRLVGRRRQAWRGFWEPAQRRRAAVWRLSLPVACACAGLLATTSMINARGTDLRGGRHSDVAQIVGVQSDKVEQLRRSAAVLQQQIDDLTRQVEGSRIEDLRREVSSLSVPAGLSEVTGPGLVVSLDDAPRDQNVPEGTDPNSLVVHQQDIQAVANALWAGGAEAMALQGQRLVSTTGIKCVGNTVVLDGVPYSPPYVIKAVGDPAELSASLSSSPQTATYAGYARKYQLGLGIETLERVKVKAYEGTVSLTYAQAMS